MYIVLNTAHLEQDPVHLTKLFSHKVLLVTIVSEDKYFRTHTTHIYTIKQILHLIIFSSTYRDQCIQKFYLAWLLKFCIFKYRLYIDGLVQKRRNSSALAMELRLSCTIPSIWFKRKLFQNLLAPLVVFLAQAVGYVQPWHNIQQKYLGPHSIKRCHLTGIGNPIVEIRRS